MEARRHLGIIRLKRNEEPIHPSAVFALLAVLCMPFSTISIGGVGLLLLIGAPLLLFSAPDMFKKAQQKVWDKATLLLIGFFAFAIAGYAWTPSFSTYSLYNFLKIILIVACLYSHTYNKREKNLLLAGSVLSCLIVCFFMLTESRHMTYFEGRATISVFGEVQDPNYLGFVFVVPLAVALQSMLNKNAWWIRLICAVFCVMILYCVLTTGSRGALMGIAAVVVVMVVGRFKTMMAKIMFCVMMALLVLVVFDYLLVFLPQSIASRFTLQDILNTRGTDRIDLWIRSFQKMKEAPYMLLLGFGTGSSVAVTGKATHNHAIQLLLEMGVVGTVLFFGFMVFWIRRLMKCDVMCLSILCGCMALGLSLSVNSIYYFWIPLMLGIVCSKYSRPDFEGERET